MRARVVLIGLLLSAAACGSASGGVEPDGADGEAAPELEARCGGIELPAGPLDINAFPPLDGQLAAAVELAVVELAPEWPVAEWRLVSRSATGAALISVDHSWGEGVMYARLEVRDGRMQPVGWGGCQVEVSVEGFGVATFTIAREDQPSPDDDVLRIQATERACAGGRVPGGRQVRTIVTESAEFIDIRVLVEDPTGAQTCPSNPSFPIVIQLDEPLGDRTVRDRWTEPPVVVPTELDPPPGRVFVDVVGSAPAAGTANVFGWDAGGQRGALLLSDFVEWGDSPTWIQSFAGETVDVIFGFVTPCDGCVEECEAGQCDELERLGPECTLEYDHQSSTDARILITYAGDTCRIDVTTRPATDSS